MRTSVRALLLTENQELIVFKRTVPGRGVYWSAPGGKIDPGETDERALRRELFEELGATVGDVRHVFTTTSPAPDGRLSTHKFFVTRLVSMDLSRRTGHEFDDPAHGHYEVQFIPCTNTKPFRWVPEGLARYLSEHAESLPQLAPGIGEHRREHP